MEYLTYAHSNTSVYAFDCYNVTFFKILYFTFWSNVLALCIIVLYLTCKQIAKCSDCNRKLIIFILFYRQTILAPLQVCNVLDKYDITALVRGSGPSGQAGAIRLAVARALSQFETAEKRDMLRIGESSFHVPARHSSLPLTFFDGLLTHWQYTSVFRFAGYLI